MDSEKGIYTATNVVTGGVIREDHNVMNVSSLGSAIHAVREQDERLQRNSKTNEGEENEEGRTSDKFSESRKISLYWSLPVTEQMLLPGKEKNIWLD